MFKAIANLFGKAWAAIKKVFGSREPLTIEEASAVVVTAGVVGGIAGCWFLLCKAPAMLAIVVAVAWVGYEFGKLLGELVAGGLIAGRAPMPTAAVVTQ